MASRTGRLFLGAFLGAVPGALLVLAGVIIGGEAALSFGVIGILLGLTGVVIGAVVGVQMKSEGRNQSMIIGAFIGVVPGLALIPIQTLLAFPVVLAGGLIGGLLGSRRSHGQPPGAPIH